MCVCAVGFEIFFKFINLFILHEYFMAVCGAVQPNSESKALTQPGLGVSFPPEL